MIRSLPVAAAACLLAFSASLRTSSADITIQLSANGFGTPRLTGNSFAGGTAPGGATPSSSSTQANVSFAAHGGSGSTSGGLGNPTGSVSYGSATTTITVTSTAFEFRVHFDGVGDVNAPSGYSNLTVGASVSFFSTAIHITGPSSIPFTIQRTGGLAATTWSLVPEAGSGASINGSNLTPGNYRFDEDADAQEDSPSAFITYNFGNGGAGNQHRTFVGDFVLTLGVPATGVCCRGSTCNATVPQASCTAPAGSQAGAVFVSAATACNSTPAAHTPCCNADYTKSGGIAVSDIFAFLSDWFASRPTTIIGGNGTTGSPNVQNIFDFLGLWFAGCS